MYCQKELKFWKYIYVRTIMLGIFSNIAKKDIHAYLCYSFELATDHQQLVYLNKYK